ncbi:dihydrofolate reductase-like [Rhagoletis pomonella]|uniref:dihydrofolate reductase-like n=1 Tax=Rhagoletis pomonella TaxID=28610 RepID=UPI00177F05C7|nr:dihydrofolate reductase-like [Rhagoletis pomonella]
MLTFNLIVAVCENFGIGLKGELPWRLRSELKYFSTTTRRRENPEKQNVVIMGRRTFFCIPENKRPLFGRLNIVLSTTLKRSELPDNVLLYPSLETAMQHLEQSDLKQQIEKVWIVGGSGVYKEAMASPRCDRIYLTEILKDFECDTFFPKIPDDFKEAKPDPFLPLGIQVEDGIQYVYKVLEKQTILD